MKSQALDPRRLGLELCKHTICIGRNVEGWFGGMNQQLSSVL
jgi:hypothetical protein